MTIDLITSCGRIDSEDCGLRNRSECAFHNDTAMYERSIGVFNPNATYKRARAAVDRASRAALSVDSRSLAFRAGKWFKASLGGDPDAARWCRKEGVTIAKAESTFPNSAGGFLVPDEVAATVLILLEQYGTARAEAATWTMTSDTEPSRVQLPASPRAGLPRGQNSQRARHRLTA